MLTAAERESLLFATFVTATKRDRYQELLKSKRGRAKVVSELDHFGDLDLNRCEKPRDQSPANIAATLRALGSPTTCYLISMLAEVDGRDMKLDEALAIVVGRGMGTFICCAPGNLAYFEGEAPGDRYICRSQPR